MSHGFGSLATSRCGSFKNTRVRNLGKLHLMTHATLWLSSFVSFAPAILANIHRFSLTSSFSLPRPGVYRTICLEAGSRHRRDAPIRSRSACGVATRLRLVLCEERNVLMVIQLQVRLPMSKTKHNMKR